MSFGFSIGDFVAIGTLIVKIISTLRDTPSEYHELIRELESLGRALTHVDRLKGRGDQAVAVDQIKCAALTCRYPLEEFLIKIQKYERSLGLEKSTKRIRDIGKKIQYGIGKMDEADRLRNYLNIHIGTINMLLVRHGLELLDLSSEQIYKNHQELRDGIEDSSRDLREVRGNVEAQALAFKENNSLIQKLFGMVSGEIAAPLNSLSQTVAKVCVSTQQIYTIVLELKASLPGINSRFTYFQAPVRVEDALGRVFPFLSECSIEALNAEIKARFKEGPGRTEVKAGEFEIFNAKNTDHVLTISGRDVLLPGMSISMAIILEKEFAEGDKCPMPHCASKTFVEAVGGGRNCSECSVWFDGASKKRKRDFEGERISKRVRTLADQNLLEANRPDFSVPNSQEASGPSSDLEETSISAFKRIRFDTGLQALTYQELIKLIDLKRDQIPYSDLQLREMFYEHHDHDSTILDRSATRPTDTVSWETPVPEHRGKNPSNTNMNGRISRTPSAEDHAPSPEKRQRQESEGDSVLVEYMGGINPAKLSDAQLLSISQQDPTVQQNAIDVYHRNIISRNEERDSDLNTNPMLMNSGIDPTSLSDAQQRSIDVYRQNLSRNERRDSGPNYNQMLMDRGINPADLTDDQWWGFS